jgi:hypothetical protein
MSEPRRSRAAGRRTSCPIPPMASDTRNSSILIFFLPVKCFSQKKNPASRRDSFLFRLCVSTQYLNVYLPQGKLYLIKSLKNILPITILKFLLQIEKISSTYLFNMLPQFISLFVLKFDYFITELHFTEIFLFLFL